MKGGGYARKPYPTLTFAILRGQWMYHGLGTRQ